MVIFCTIQMKEVKNSSVGAVRGRGLILASWLPDSLCPVSDKTETGSCWTGCRQIGDHYIFSGISQSGEIKGETQTTLKLHPKYYIFGLKLLGGRYSKSVLWKHAVGLQPCLLPLKNVRLKMITGKLHLKLDLFTILSLTSLAGYNYWLLHQIYLFLLPFFFTLLQLKQTFLSSIMS